MLVLTKEQQQENHQSAKKGLTDEFNRQLENILNANQSVEKYWILGKVKFPEELGGFVGRTFLEACMEKPPIVKEAFLYEVDNKAGTKALLWVMHPGDKLRLPTLGKTLSIGDNPKKTGVIYPGTPPGSGRRQKRAK